MAALFVAGLTLSVDGRVGAQGPRAEPPATPTGLTGTFTHESVSLSWDDPGDPGDPSITGYQILRRQRGVHEVGDFQVHVDDTNSAATSYVDTAVEAEASYVYRVKARNSSGLSERSRFFRADLPAAPDPPAPGLPGPPPNLTAAAAGETQINLSWTAPGNTNGSEIVGYRIEVSTDRGTSWNDLVAGTGSTGTTYAHPGLVSGAMRHYRVSAINSVGTGAPSNIASATTGDLTPPRFVAGVVGADGDSLELYFNESLDLDPGRTPLSNSFVVTADGAPVAVGAVQAIPGRAQSVSLIGLSPAIREGQTASVSYTDPTSGNDEAAIQDRAGNDAASLADQPVTNGSTLTGASTRGAPAQDVVTQPATATATAQIGAILAAKAQRTPAQRKVSSQFLDAIGSPQLPEGQEGGGEEPQPPARSGPRRPAATDGVAEVEFVTVDIRADVTPEVLGRIRALGGTVINSVPKYRAIRAQLPLVAVQPLAALSAVQSIRPADEAVTHKNTSEGDAAHLVNTARTTHGVTGSGIGIGVLSNGVATLAARQASGDLPAQVAVLPGQEGSGDEGTAMLEIVHDLAPGADLYFATGFSGQAQFAANIEALCEAGADVIVDDISYYLEASFQDSIITQGVNAATANGCYFFSSAGNSGNLNDGTSGVWEGDYAAGSSLRVGDVTVGVRHDFGGGKEENAVRGAFFGRAVLQWTDPLGASANDYDLFLVDGDGNVLLSSTDTQDGAQDPIETFSLGFFAFEGVRLVIVKVSGEARYLRLQLFPAKLQIATAGATFGHSASENAVGVGQVDVRTAGGAGGIFDGTESVTAGSSDGPRRIFFEPDGTPITPGDFSSTGGKVLKKPDLSAASCVSTATPGFSTFCGTSAAAPHAAAIAALMLAAAGGPAHVTPADLRMKMTATTAVLDIEEAGFDNNSGAGIVMAPGAIAGVAVAVADRNGAPTVTTTLADRTLAAGLGAVTIDLASIFTDPDSDALTYSVVSSDPDRLGVTLSGTEVTLTPGSPGWSAVWARVTDPGGLGALQTFTVTVTAGTTDYDTDDNGLIEVTTLAQLDAIRYDLNGNGLVDGATWEPYYAAFSMGALEMGCPNGCVGYELAANLDFDTDGSGIADSPDTYWNSGAGWVPIGSEDNPFTALFHGHGHTLANLFIDRPTEDGIGLFGELHYGGATSHIRDVGLVEVDVTGRDRVGALFGRSTYMTVFKSYATGRVTGRGDKVGGLAGESWGNLIDTYAAVEVSGEEAVGGLVGHHILNRVTTSYATGRVSGMYAVGGLVGATSDFFHLIQASYATGDVSGVGARLSMSDSGFIVCGFLGTVDAETSSGGGIGGLVGHSCGRIEASYATGAVSGGAAAGGLLGSGLYGSIGFSYWDMETSGLRVGVGEEDTNDNGVVDGAELQRASLVGMTTAALQEPTDYDGIYSAWAVDLGGPGFGDGEPDELWDFGATTQYPALSVDLNGDDRATWQEFGYQFRSALALAATTTSGQAQVDLSWAAADVRPWTPAPSVTYTVYRDDGFTVVAVAEDLTGTVYADTGVAPGARYSYQVAAVVGGGEVVRSARAPVTAGAANQPPVAAGILADRTLLLRTDAVTVDVAAAFRDPDGDTLTHAAASSAPSVASVSVSGSEVAITPETGGRAIITVTVTDSVGSNPSATQRFTVTVGNDYDSDDDGLIEIQTLAQLDAMRHNLDGGVIPDDRAAFALAFPAPLDRMGCGLEGCSGYELMADLDFDTDGSGTANAGDTYWNGGAGWAPIGIPEFLSSRAFSTTLDGNDHVIANLFVNGGDYAGLFGALGESGVIRNLSLTDIDVTGEYSAGGLVGQNAGTVIASHATGTVRGQDLVGGLVGDNYYGGSITRSSSLATATSPPSPPICPPPCVVVSSEPRGAGGLVGLNRGTIDSSYATGDVTGYPAGGLVGWNFGGGIIASYATGAVTGTTVGGLVGRNDGPSVFERSYATGRVSGNLDVGGLVGTNASGITASYSTGPASATSSTASSVGGLVGGTEGGFSRIRQSYWDSTTSGIAGGQSTAALQGPTGDTGIYGAWNGPWHFGTSSQYPALSVDFDGDGDETWQEFGHQLRTGPELMATGGEGQVVLNWAALDESPWTPPPGITYTLYRDATVVAENLSTLSYQDSGLTAGDYTYQLAAVVNGGEATRSALVTGTVREVRLNNQPRFPSSETGARSVDENTAAGMNIGTAIAAEDDDDDPLTYSITRGANLFDINPATGQLLTKAALDRETAPSHTIRVGVSDGKDANNMAEDPPVVDNRISVTVTVTDVDEPPILDGPENVDYAENRGDAVASYTAADPENEDLDWTLEGPDRDLFEIGSSGVLAFKLPPDHETRLDSGGNNVYDVIVRATERDSQSPLTGTRTVAVTVTNVNEPPTIDGLANVDYAEGGTGNVATYRAVDPEGATIIWTLAGAQGGKFTITNGVLKFRETPDFEERPSYALIVEASDGNPRNVASIDVTITVSNANEPPVVSGITEIERFEDNATGTLANYTADDPDGNDVIWDVIGVDRNDFVIDASGALSFKDPVDYDDPSDSNRDNIFNIEVTATEDGGPQPLRGKLPVTVTVRDVNDVPEFPSTENGMRSVPENTPARRNVGAPVAAVAGDNDTLTYSITSGANLFDINTATGQLLTKAPLDREAAPSHTIRVGVSDGKDANNMAEDPPVVDNRISVTIAVGDVDEAPKVMGPEAVTKAENSGTSVGAYTADDPEIKAVTWETLRGADAGHFAFDDGALSFVSEPDFEARRDNTYEVTVRARDEGGKIGERPVTVTVTNVDEPPTIDGLANVDYAEGGTGNVATYRAVDPEGATIIWTLAGAQGDDFTITNGVLRFRETPDFEERSRYALIVEASDGNARNVASIDVTITVSNANEPPVVSGITEIERFEDNATGTLANYTADDPDGNDVIWDVIGVDRNDFVIDASGALSFKDPVDYDDPSDSNRDNIFNIEVTATEDGGPQPLRGKLPVTVTVRDVNETPEFPPTENGMRNVPENTPAGRTFGAPVAAVAGDNDTLTYSITRGANLFDINPATGQLLTKAPLDREAAPSHTIRVGVSDGKDANNMAEDPPVVDNRIWVTVTVTNVDEPPVVTGTKAVTKAENSGEAVGEYTATDPEDKDLTWETLMGADAGHFAFDNGALSFKEDPDYEARPDNTYEVTVRARDERGNIGELRVTVTITNVDERPTITGDDAPSIEEGGTLLDGTYQATDPESATIAWQPLAGSDAGKFEFTPSNGRLAFKAAPDFEDPDRGGDNEYDVTLSVSAGSHTIPFDVAVTVTNKEEPGMLALPPTQPQAEADYTATLSDPDGVQSTTWTWERSTSRSGPWATVSGAFDSTTTSVYTPVTGDVGHYLRATAAYTDGHGPNKSRVAVSTNSVRAKPVINNPPEFTETNPTRSVAENAGANATVGRAVTATDPDLGPGNTVRYEFESPGSDLFTIDASSGQIRVKTQGSLDYDDPANRTQRVTVKALDSSNAFDTVQVTIEVTNVNEPPDAVADTARTREDTAVTIDVLANDSDPEDDRSELLLTVFNSGPNAPRNGTVTVNEPANVGENRTITYAPKANYNGSDTFTYQVRDTGSPSLSSTASVTVQIDAVNDAPVFPPSETGARSVSESAKAGANVGAAVTATDIDENDTLTYRLFGAGASSFEIDSNGQITVGDGVTFDIATKDTYTVMVEAYDGNGRATVKVTITVTARPVGPPIITGGGGGGGGGPSGPSPSEVDFEWNVKRDIEELDGGHDKPTGSWSDGTTLWLAENGDGADDAVYAYDLKTGERLEEREFELDEANRAPRGLWSNGQTAWVADSGRDRLFAYDLESGERDEEREVELDQRNRDPRGIWSDGTTVWVLDGGKNALFAYDLETGALLGEYALNSSNGDPHGIWSDGVSVWVSDHGAKRLFAYRIPVQDTETTTGEDAAPVPLERVRDEEFANLSRASNNSPRGIWSDGAVMYVADESDGKVYTYNMPDALDARLASLTLSGVDFGEFLPGRTEYDGVAAEGVTETTVEAGAVQRRTDVAIHPPDADDANGHQVALQDLGEITVTVTSADGNRRRVYRVRFEDTEREAPSYPTSRCFRGDVVEGFSLLIYEGGSLEDLVVCAVSRYVVALYVLDNGVYVPYILGAPDFVNRSFRELYADGLPPMTSLVAGSNGPPSADTVVGRLAEDEPVTLRGSNCLHGEIAAGFSLAIFEGGSVEELEACGRGLGITAFHALHEGDWAPFILGAPDFVNRPFFELFADGLPALTPLVATRDSPPAANADSDEAAEN